MCVLPRFRSGGSRRVVDTAVTRYTHARRNSNNYIFHRVICGPAISLALRRGPWSLRGCCSVDVAAHVPGVRGGDVGHFFYFYFFFLSRDRSGRRRDQSERTWRDFFLFFSEYDNIKRRTGLCKVDKIYHIQGLERRRRSLFGFHVRDYNIVIDSLWTYRAYCACPRYGMRLRAVTIVSAVLLSLLRRGYGAKKHTRRDLHSGRRQRSTFSAVRTLSRAFGTRVHKSTPFSSVGLERARKNFQSLALIPLYDRIICSGACTVTRLCISYSYLTFTSIQSNV